MLNPEKFLPLASGAGVAIAITYYLYNSLTKTNKDVHEIIDTIVDEEMKQTIIENFEKNPALKFTLENIDNLPQATFNKALNTFFVANNLEEISRDKTDEILNGNISVLTNTLESYLGINSTIGLGVIGILMQDHDLILDSVEKLSKDLKTDPRINKILTRMILNSLDSKSSCKNKVSSITIQ